MKYFCQARILNFVVLTAKQAWGWIKNNLPGVLTREKEYIIMSINNIDNIWNKLNDIIFMSSGSITKTRKITINNP